MADKAYAGYTDIEYLRLAAEGAFFAALNHNLIMGRKS